MTSRFVYLTGLAGSAFVAFLALSTDLAHGTDIVDTAVVASNFTTRVTAVKAAGLVDTLKGPGPFTVFAPTDAGFADLSAGTDETLLKPQNKVKLGSIVTDHVLPGRVLSKAIVGKKLGPKTLRAQTLAIDASESAVKVDDVAVKKADNSVIYAIDTVLLPI